MYMDTDYNIYMRNPLPFYLPLLIPLCSPFCSPLLTWNPPSCDRIRPPWSLVACKLNSSFPSPCPYTPHSKIPTPRGFSHPNIHSLGWHREPGSQSPAHLRLTIVSVLEVRFRKGSYKLSLWAVGTFQFFFFLFHPTEVSQWLNTIPYGM